MLQSKVKFWALLGFLSLPRPSPLFFPATVLMCADWKLKPCTIKQWFRVNRQSRLDGDAVFIITELTHTQICWQNCAGLWKRHRHADNNIHVTKKPLNMTELKCCCGTAKSIHRRRFWKWLTGRGFLGLAFTEGSRSHLSKLGSLYWLHWKQINTAINSCVLIDEAHLSVAYWGAYLNCLLNHVHRLWRDTSSKHRCVPSQLQVERRSFLFCLSRSRWDFLPQNIHDATLLTVCVI